MAWGSKISHGTGVRQKSPFRKGQRMPAMRVLTSLGEFYSQPEGLLPDPANEEQLNTQNQSQVSLTV